MHAIDVATTYFVEGDVVKTPNNHDDIQNDDGRHQYHDNGSRVISRSASSLPRIGHPKSLSNGSYTGRRGSSAVPYRNKVASPISVLSSDIIPSVLKINDEKLAYVNQSKSSSRLSTVRTTPPKSNQPASFPHQFIQADNNYISTSGIRHYLSKL